MKTANNVDAAGIATKTISAIEKTAVVISVTTIATCTLVLLPLAVASFGPFAS